jgi:hypothetical protein
MTTTGATTTSSIPGTAAASEGGAGVTSPSNTAAVGAAVAGGTELLAAAGGGSSGDNVSEADQARQRAKARQVSDGVGVGGCQWLEDLGLAGPPTMQRGAQPPGVGRRVVMPHPAVGRDNVAQR